MESGVRGVSPRRYTGARARARPRAHPGCVSRLFRASCSRTLGVALLAGCASVPTPGVMHSPPPEILGAFEDDYGSSFRIQPGAWHHGSHSTYDVVEWNVAEQYLVARNAARNRSAPGLWTRIDWMPLQNMAPYTWAYCLSAYEAPTRAAAAETRIADRNVPKTGCNGHPFSRMKRTGSAEDGLALLRILEQIEPGLD